MGIGLIPMFVRWETVLVTSNINVVVVVVVIFVVVVVVVVVGINVLIDAANAVVDDDNVGDVDVGDYMADLKQML